MTRINVALFALVASAALTGGAWAEDFVINTDVTETNGGATLESDDSITVTENGSVETSDLFADGLEATGGNNTLTNNGTVTTGGDDSLGLSVSGSSNTLTNSGSVTTIGLGAYGLFASGVNNALTNSGTVATFGSSASGLYASGSNSTLTNSSLVTTSGSGAHGFIANGADNTLTNNGSVTTGGGDAFGLFARGDTNTLTNNGSVTTSGSFALGLFALGNFNTLTNRDIVATFGSSASGLYAVGNASTLTNSGSVTTNGGGARGLYAIGNTNTLTNSGTVTTGGVEGFGLWAEGANSTLTNSGSVTTIGEAAYGLFAAGDTNILTNSGSVTTSGMGAAAVFSLGSNHTVTNSGRLLSAQDYSVEFASGSGATLNLLEGSVLQGDVYFSDPETATLSFGPGLNAVVRTAGGVPATITAPDDHYVVDGQTVYVIDGGYVRSTEQVIGGVATLMLDTLGQQMSHESMAPAVTQGVAGTQREAWGQAFGTERSADGSGGDSTTAGFMVGADLDDVRGLFVGAARSTQEVDANNDLDSDNLFAGYYANYTLNGFDVDASLTVGMATNSTERSVANNTVVGGLETAAAEYNSYYLMPAATFSGDIPVASGSLTPSVRVSYAAIRDQAYTETGSAANLDVDSRTSHLFSARVQLDRGLRGYAIGSGMLLANLRAGFDGQHTKGGDITAALLGQSFELQASSDETSGRGFAGVDLRHVSDSLDLEFYSSMEVGRTSTEVTDVSLKLGAVFRF